MSKENDSAARGEHRSPGTQRSCAFNIYSFSVSHMESPLTYGTQGTQKGTTSWMPLKVTKFAAFFYAAGENEGLP